MAKTNHDDFGDENKVKDIWWKKGKVGDRLKGTLISVKKMASSLPGKEGELVTIYELKALFGEFHDTDENKKVLEAPTLIEEGMISLVSGTLGIDNKMRNAKVGDIVGFRYASDSPNKKKGFNPTKNVDVFFYGKDEAWLKEQTAVNDPAKEQTPFDIMS